MTQLTDDIWECDTFYCTIIKMGDSCRITIPKKLMEVGQYVEGDNLKVMIKRQVRKENEPQ